MFLRILPIVLLVLCASHNLASASDSKLPLSLSYNSPTGPESRPLDLSGGLGFSLGYTGEVTRWLRMGAAATWTSMSVHGVDNIAVDNVALTVYQLVATARFRAFRHGWSPYVDTEAGMSFVSLSARQDGVSRAIDGLDEVRALVGTRLGIEVPISERVSLDVAGRFSWTFIDEGFGIAALHAGIVYELR